MAAPAKVSSPLMLVCGGDDFSVKERAKAIFQDWSRELGGMDHEIIDAGAANSGEALTALSRLRESLQTLPFFGSGKAVWFKDCNFLGDERTAEAGDVTRTLGEIAAELKEFDWKGVRLLISAGKVDKRKTFYKTIEKLGSVESFAGWSPDDKNWQSEAEIWARQAFRSRSKEISDEALSQLVTCVGPNAQQLKSEVEKLVLYVGEKPKITTGDVGTLTTKNKTARAFALADALGERNLPHLLRHLDEEIWQTQFDSQKNEIGLLYGLIYKVRSMILAKEMLAEGWIQRGMDYSGFKSRLERLPSEKLPEDKRFNPLQINAFVLWKSAGHSERYTRKELVRAMEILLQCNQRLVSGSANRTLVLQQALVEIAAKPQDAPEKPMFEGARCK